MNYIEEQRVVADKTKLYLRRYASANSPTEIVIVHGFGEHSGRYELLVEHLLAQGFSVTTYDHRGHGKSAGLYGHVDGFADYEDDLEFIVSAIYAEQQPKKLFLVGHSMGGLVALRYLMKPRANISGAVISAPLVEIAAKVPASKLLIAKISAKLLPRMRMQNEINPAVLSRDASIGKAYAADPLVGKMVSSRWFVEAVKAMNELQYQASQITLPLLVMHGTEDKLASCEATKKLFSQIRSADKELKIYEGYYHELFNEPEKQEVYERVSEWLNSRSG
ncbi:MAG: lysophospholipase [Acidobacteriota bacterium]